MSLSFEVAVRLATSTRNRTKTEQRGKSFIEKRQKFNSVDELQIDGRNLCFRLVRFFFCSFQSKLKLVINNNVRGRCVDQ